MIRDGVSSLLSPGTGGGVVFPPALRPSTSMANRGSPLATGSPSGRSGPHARASPETSSPHLAMSRDGSRMSVFEEEPVTHMSGSSSKFVELKNKLTEMDVDLKNQRIARASKESKVFLMEESVKTLQMKVTALERRITEQDDALKKTNAMAAMDRNARDAMERTLYQFIDERMSVVLKTVADSVRRTEADADAMKRRVRQLEEASAAERALLEREAKSRMELESVVTVKHAEQLLSISKDLAKERQTRHDDVDQVRRTLLASFAGLQTACDQDRAKRDRQFEYTEDVLRRLSSEIGDFQAVVRKELEKAGLKQTAPLSEAVLQLQSGQDVLRKAVDELVKDSSRKLEESGIAVRNVLKHESGQLDYKMVELQKHIDEKLWKFQHLLQSETEQRMLDVRRACALIEEERRAREDESEDMAKLLERSFHKIREGISGDRVG